MITITPEEFWNAFANRLSKSISITHDWRERYKSSPKWTKTIIPIIEKIGLDLGLKKDGREIDAEYYTIDVGYYSVKTPVKDDFGINYDYNWDFEVAIEHENNSKTWFEEFAKLVHINCGLKVIITYHDYKNVSNTLENKLQIIKTLYGSRKYHQNPDMWLLIFGPTTKCLDRDFVAYKFNGKDVEQLPEKEILSAIDSN